MDEFFPVTENIIISASDPNKLSQFNVNLRPELSHSNEPVTLLIVVSGYVYENGEITDEKVGAYAIIELSP